MENSAYNAKGKILNDPIYGFISLPSGIVLDTIDHPWFQRLRHIKQLGLSHLVYPGALHTRFQHAIGAMYLMGTAIESLRAKGVDISDEGAQGAKLAILLHDVGHGPFSHTLEHSILDGVHHEDISALVMDRLNEQFNGALEVGISIFRDQYSMKPLHKLVSSQLDMDRLDYLMRDSFFSGVAEGIVGSDRIIKMLNVRGEELVIEQKGIYSIEKFIVARRLMYWQVYLHKTVVAAEYMLMNILKRAKELAAKGEELFCSPVLREFLYNSITAEDLKNDHTWLSLFMQLDDHDIMGAVKVWANHKDNVLRRLSADLVGRRIFKLSLQEQPFTAEELHALREKVRMEWGLNEIEASYFVLSDEIENSAYNPKTDRINMLMKDGTVRDLAEASDNLNIGALSAPVKKYFLAIPAEFNATKGGFQRN